MEYGSRPDDHSNRTLLLTGAALATGIFALHGIAKPWGQKVFQNELKHVAENHPSKEIADFAKHLLSTSIPKLSTTDAAKMWISRSKGMQYWERLAHRFVPAQLADELGFIRHTREAWGHNAPQVQAFDHLYDIGIFGKTGRFPDGLPGDRPAFYAGGQLWAKTGDTTAPYQQIKGKFQLYGLAAAGERKSVFERSIEELTGASTNREALGKRLQRLYNRTFDEAEEFALGSMANEKPGWWNHATIKSQYDADTRKHMAQSYYELHRVRRTIKRLSMAKQQTTLGARIRGWFDYGFNEQSITAGSAEWRDQIRDDLGGLLHPSDVPINRKTAGFGVVRSMQWNRQGLREMFFGGHTHSGVDRLTAKNGQINAGTIALYHLFNRINTDVARNGIFSGLALSGHSATSPFDFIKAIMLKRALPMYAGGFYLGYLNDNLKNKQGERPSDRLRDARGSLDRHWAHYKDRHHITQHMRNLDELSGGFVGYVAHPFLETPVGLSEHQLEQQQQSGDVAVRKGRWWLFGSSTPFRGERVQYFTPYYSRWAKAGDVYKTDTLWGNKDEFYANAALPTPTHPFAPIHHFITDRYHYEKKHYKDRPYPLSSPLFEPTSLHGAILNPLVGWLLKPVQHYHVDDMPYYMSGPHRGERNPHYRGEIRSLNQQIKDKAAEQELVGYVTPSGEIDPMVVVSAPHSDRQTATMGQQVSLGAGVTSQKYLARSGGKLNREDIRARNKEIRDAARFSKGGLLEPASPPGLFGIDDPNSPLKRKHMISSYDPRYQAGLAYYSATEIGGIYGFGSVSATGDLYARKPTLQNAGRMTSFERTYWDRWNTGGLAPTPGLSEVFRRFLPHRYHSNEDISPIRNQMAPWLPGAGGEDPAYFINYLTGDPYTKLPNGETRLPGTSYEKLHGIAPLSLGLRNTQVGYDPQMIYGFLTGDHEPFAAYSQEIADRGGEIQEQVIRELTHSGTPIRTHVQYEDANHVSGTVDAVTDDTAIQIHTLSAKRYAQLAPEGEERYRTQLNYDMEALGLHHGQAIYVNRDDPTQRRTIDQDYDANLYKHTVENIAAVRGQITREYHAGQWGTGQFYDDITKLQILGDVAPWSQQYKRYRDYLTHLDTDELSPEDRAKIIAVKHEVTQRKKRFHMTPYRAKYAALNYEDVHVKDVIDANTFTTREHPDNPVRLAGVHIAAANSPWAARYIHPGAALRIGVAADPTQTISRDTLHTLRAVVYSGNTMINREALTAGVGSERDENTPAGMHVRYSDKEFREARFFEWLGHANIPFIHNKFLPMDSPLELYRRNQVYGKDWQDWKHPFADYIAPSFESFAQQGFWGDVGAFILGGALTRGNFKERGKWGLIAIGITKGLQLFRSTSGHEIPAYRRKERDIDEYFDILKYVKYEGLYEKTRNWIQHHEHHDIGAIIDRYKSAGDQRKRRIQILKQEKRQLIVSGHKASAHARLIEINHEIAALQSYRAELPLSREDIVAIQYKTMADTTLFGAEPGGDMRKVMLAMNPKEREFFQAFVKAPGAEREAILKIIPENEKRFLEAAWGMKYDERPNLREYFTHHYLPKANWNGWRADSDLDDYKLVVLKDDKINLTSHGFWPQDEERVAEEGLLDLQPNRRTPDDVRSQLHAALGGMGLRDIDIQISRSQHKHSRVRMQISNDRKDEISQYQGNAL